jgi:GTP pyrophosphokinase
MGTGDVLTLLARCCRPVPGDPIIGYVTRARGVTVHRTDCANVLNIKNSEPERLVDAEWGERGQFFPVSVRVEAFDRVGLLRDLTTIAADEKVNLTAVRTLEHTDRSTTVLLTLETSGVEQLSRLFAKLEGVYGVHSVSREQGYASRPRTAPASQPTPRLRLTEP